MHPRLNHYVNSGMKAAGRQKHVEFENSNLWRHGKKVKAYSTSVVNVWMINRSDKPHTRRMEGISEKLRTRSKQAQ